MDFTLERLLCGTQRSESKTIPSILVFMKNEIKSMAEDVAISINNSGFDNK